jgi:hypothetical protein
VPIIFTFLASPPGRCTTVLLYRDSTRIVVGADSLSGELSSGASKTSSLCKIRKTGNVYVSMAGYISATSNGFDAYRLASSAIAHSTGVAESAKQFARLSIRPFQESVSHERRYHPDLYKSETKRGADALVIFFMSFENSVPTFASVTFTITEDSTEKVSVATHLDFCPGHGCPGATTGPGNLVFLTLGVVGAIDRFVGDHAAFPTDLHNDPVSTIRRLIEIEIRESPDLVGLPIDILTISKDGATWSQRGMCR